MAVTAFWYGLGLQKVAAGATVWDTHSIKALLATSSYTPSQDTHQTVADVTDEVVGTGYTAGGLVVATRTLSYDAPTNEVRFLGDDPAWPSSTITARYMVLYNDTPAAGSKWLLGYVDFGANMSSTDTTFSLAFPNRTHLRITAL